MKIPPSSLEAAASWMGCVLRLAATLALGLALIACSSPLREAYPPARGEPVTSVFVVSPEGVWPEHRRLGAAEQLEVAWGDRDFYMAPRGTLRLALRAAFWSSASVLTSARWTAPSIKSFPGRRSSRCALRRLAGFFQDAYARDPAEGILLLGRGQYASSRFCAASEKYSLLRTCNTWTARALREAGLPIEPLQVVTAAGLMDELRKLVQVDPPP
jgi:hypothetical protein